MHMKSMMGIVAAASLVAGSLSVAQTPVGDWQRHVFLDRCNSAEACFYTAGNVSGGSTLELVDKKLPIDTHHFVSGAGALRLHWTSAVDGSWDVELRLATWPNRAVNFAGDTLSFSVFAPQGIDAAAMPNLTLRDGTNGFTERLPLRDFARSVRPGVWTRVSVPLARFRTTSVRPFHPEQTTVLIFSQAAGDGVEHTLLMDDVRFDAAVALSAGAPPAPTDVAAKGYDRHVLVTWQAPPAAHAVADYVVYRAEGDGPFQAIGTQRPDIHRYVDFLGNDHTAARYRVTARAASLRESAPSPEALAATHPMSDEELLTMVQEASFQFYWDGAEPHSGLALESIPGNPDLIAVGGSGFGIMSLVVGAERGFAPREEIVARMLRITNFLAHADRFHGAWPHFLYGSSGHMAPNFGMYDDGADLVETSFLVEGLLAARGYFTRDTPAERQLRQEITALWEGVEWDWFRATPKRDALYWHWSPDFGFHIANRLQGWNETMITYMLAIASPTHGAPASIYYSGWAGEGNPAKKFGEPQSFYGIPVAMTSNGSTGPLFFTHYSFMGYDPRGVRDKYADYFTSNRNASLVQQKYAIENAKHFKGYGANGWGMSAVTGPTGYREFKPFTVDDGTLAPTAAMGAYAYTPEASLLALKHFYRDLGAQVWDVYGFRNAFNETVDWYSPATLGLNQGPQTVMIENGRTGLVWKSFMNNPEIKLMQQAIGLTKAETK